MSTYRRPYRYNRPSGPTPVTLAWSQKSSAYSLKFQDTNHWNEMQPFIAYLKTIPYGERDYDPENKIWYFVEKYLSNIRAMLDPMEQAGIFTVTFHEKPANQTSFAKFVPLDLYIDKFKNISGVDIKQMDYATAKKAYRRACMQNHPDRGGDPAKMADLNESWMHIEESHFNIKKDIEYSQVQQYKKQRRGKNTQK